VYDRRHPQVTPAIGRVAESVFLSSAFSWIEKKKFLLFIFFEVHFSALMYYQSY